MRRLLPIILLPLMLAACDEPIYGKVGAVILYRDGQARQSNVYIIGGSCWVAWYARIEKVLLRSDGFAYDSPFKYRWTLDRPGADDPNADKAWFAKNCLDPPN